MHREDLEGGREMGRRMKETVRKVDHNCQLIRCHEKANEVGRKRLDGESYGMNY